MPIDITDDRERVDVIQLFVLEHPDLKSVSSFLLLTKDKHAFYQRFGFQAEWEMAMILRR